MQSRIACPPQPLGREDRPLRHPAGEAGRLGPEQDVPHLGPDAIGADDDVGIPPRAVLEDEPDRLALALQSHETMCEGDRAGSDGRFEHRMQIATVNVDVRPAEALLAGGIEGQLVQRLARVPGAADERIRADARFQEAAFYP